MRMRHGRVSRLACGRRAVSTERSKLSFPQCSIKNTFAYRLAAHCWPSYVTQR